MNNWYQLSADKVLELVDSTPNGLSTAEAKHRLHQQGTTSFPGSKQSSSIAIIIRQLISPFNGLLLVAIIISLLLKERIDALAITAALLLNCGLGIYYELRSRYLTEQLHALTPNRVHVLRSGSRKIITGSELVVGDIIFLSAGQRIPADCRLLAVNLLRVDESILTGEVLPACKNTAEIDHPVLLPEQLNMVFRGTFVTHGIAEGVVVATGLNTEIGSIQSLVEHAETPETPLARQVRSFGQGLTIIALLAAFLYYLLIVLTHHNSWEAVRAAAALGVSAVPEGLPVIITLGLLIGVHQMAQKKALVKNSSALDTIAFLTTIITDKTGTITENNLKSCTLLLPSSTGFLQNSPTTINPFTSGLSQFLLTAVLSTEAAFSKTIPELHDPLERALLATATGLNVDTGRVLKMHRPLLIIPFSSESKYVAIAFRHSSKEVIWYIKGAPELVVKQSSYIYRHSHPMAWEEQDKDEIRKLHTEIGSKGEKLVSCALRITSNELLEKIKKTPEHASKLILKELTFVGSIGFCDALRSDAAAAIIALQKEGVRVKIATGDQDATARAVAQALHLPHTAAHHPQRLNYKEVTVQAVFSRVQPSEKLQIITSLQQHGEVVAMIGDGINDVPALKQADIGIALGASASDAAHDIADIILLENSLSTLREALHFGRALMRNLRLIILFLLATSLLEIVSILLIGVLTGGTLALHPTQILWLNLFTDTLLAFPLLYEPNLSESFEKGSKHNPLFSSRAIEIASVSTAALFLSSLWLFFTFFNPSSQTVLLSQSLLFHALCWGEIGILLTLRQPARPFLSYWRENPPLTSIAALVFMVQLLAMFSPWLRPILHTAPLTLTSVFAVVISSCSGFLVGELFKIFSRLKKS